MKRGRSVSRGAAAAVQKAYYEDTSAHYDVWHLKALDEHDSALQWIDFLFPNEQIASILDVGSGTGRAIEFFHGRGRRITGAEPSAAQIAQAIKKGVPPGVIVQADGRALPFADGSFDAVSAFGMLHHVSRPELVISEMVRVARKAVFISDGNRFGQGRPIARLGKLALHKAGLWNLAEVLRTRGKRYHFSDRDGVFYSFSVYDHVRQLADAAEHVWLLPVTAGDRRGWFCPLLTHGHVLVCAFKEGFAPAMARQTS